MLRVGKVVGLNSDQNCAQVLINHPDVLEPSSPSLFIIIKCESDDAFSRARQALVEGETYFDENKDELSEKISGTSNIIKENLKDVSEVRLLVACTYHNQNNSKVIYLLCDEGFSAYLLRDETETNLAKLAPYTQLISGFIKEGDKLIFSTENLVSILGGNFSKLQNLSPQEIEDEIAMGLPQDKVDPLAAIFLEEYIEGKKSISMPRLESVSPYQGNLNRIKPKLPQINLGFLSKFKSKKLLILPIILLVLFGLIFGGSKIFKKLKPTTNANNFDTNLSVAQASLEKAKTDQSEPDLEKIDIQKGLTAINSALEKKPDDSNAQAVKLELQTLQTSLDNIDQVADFPMWLDLSLIKTGLKTDRLSLSGTDLLVFDDISKVLVKIATDTKSNNILAGEDKLGLGQFATTTDDSSFVYSSDLGILAIDNNNSAVSKVSSKDSNWGQIIDINGFSSNVYILDKGKNQIWKYVPIVDGYSDVRSYLKGDVKTDFSTALRMQIDGSIYILLSGGKILKFTEGESDSLELTGLDKGLNNPKSFYTSGDTDNIYILDSGNNRLVVVDKKGAFVAQYKSDKFNIFSDLVVDEKNKKVYLLSSDKIFTMDLK